MRKIFILVLSAAIFAFGCNSDSGTRSQRIIEDDAPTELFSDPIIDEEVRAQVNKPVGPLTEEDLLSIEALDLYGRWVFTLRGLENLKNLIFLDIRETQVTNLAVLEQLPQLEILKFSNQDQQYIENIEVLSKLQNLKELDVFGLQDLSFLADLSQLEVLSIQQACSDAQECEDLTFVLRDFSSLKELYLFESAIISLDFLIDLPQLEALDLHYSVNLGDLSPAAALENLKILNIEYNYLTDADIEPFTGNRTLETLYIGGNCIKEWDIVFNFVAGLIEGTDEQDYCK